MTSDEKQQQSEPKKQKGENKRYFLIFGKHLLSFHVKM
jgi:hypothetical protein